MRAGEQGDRGPLGAGAALRDWLVGHRVPDLPRVSPTPVVAGKFLFDELTLQMEHARGRLRPPTPSFRRRLRSELEDALDLFQREGWLDDPRSYHADPPALLAPRVRTVRLGFLAYEHLRFESGWTPWPDEPGRDRWLEYGRNATAHCWVLRHEGGPRPWLVCVNGYRTGEPVSDLWAFRAEHLHRRLGLNLAFLVPPLHGPRSHGASGDRVMFSGALNTIHTAAQAAWDVRRLLSWIRDDQAAPVVGVAGLSLGGFITALVASLDGELALAMPGIPEADLVRGMRRTIDPLLPPFYEQWGLSWAPFERVHRVVSPMAMKPLVPHEARYLFAGLVDRWVRPGNVHALWEHWGRPEICWYEGGHLSYRFEPEVKRFVDAALRDRLGV